MRLAGDIPRGCTSSLKGLGRRRSQTLLRKIINQFDFHAHSCLFCRPTAMPTKRAAKPRQQIPRPAAAVAYPKRKLLSVNAESFVSWREFVNEAAAPANKISTPSGMMA
jgi:hypothetical protein